MPGLTVEYLADTEETHERRSGIVWLHASHTSAHAELSELPSTRSFAVRPNRGARSELVTLAVVVSLTQLAAVAARGLSWLGRDGVRARRSRPKGV